MKTYSQKPVEVVRNWYVIDAEGVPLGRLANQAARYLLGKHKPTYTPHIDGGDTIIVINADKIKITGNKLLQKRYYRHSGYPGGIYSKTLEQQMQQDSREVIKSAVNGMLPDNRLKSDRMLRLKIYSGTEHPHDPQQPKKLGVN
ncbi:MAG: 50S ribosomal protein L13 [Candidatus Saccharimonadales bacterium]